MIGLLVYSAVKLVLSHKWFNFALNYPVPLAIVLKSVTWGECYLTFIFISAPAILNIIVKDPINIVLNKIGFFTH